MSYPKEQDPLLPKQSRAPEIHGSRPQSFNDDVDIEPTTSQREVNMPPRAKTINDLMAMVFGLCVALSLIFVFLRDDLFDGLLPRPTPATIEERVNHILTDTPLIGICCFCLSATSI